MTGSGILYVVATPIGNLGDMSPRAREVLQSVDLIAAEDTRHSSRLLQHFDIRTRMLSCHDHNERQVGDRLLRVLREGRDVALISDAGTPLISDPGYSVVRELRAAGIRIVPVPGPSAILAALSAAGLPTDRFVFEGFLPARHKARCERLVMLADEPRTVVMLESSHRICASVADIAACVGEERELVLARELTKTFEQIHADSAAGMADWLMADANRQRGEFVLVMAGAAETRAAESALRRVLEPLLDDLPLKQAVSLAVRISGESRKRLYRLALDIRDGAN